MSRFKRIKNKSNKKSFVLIDEKIVALNKELEKTGMLSEIMTTDNVYSTSTYVPPQEPIVSEVPNSSNVGGDGFNQSSASSGNEGDAPTYSSTADLFNTTQIGVKQLNQPSYVRFVMNLMCLFKYKKHFLKI